MNSKALILLAVQASSLLSPALAVCESECTTQDPSGDFTVAYNGRCTKSAFLSKVADTAVHSCLTCLYNSHRGTALTDINDVVGSLCVDGYAADVFPFAEISGRGAQFDNEHYAGGGEWNYEIETAAGEDVLRTDAQRVDLVYHYEAQRKVIELPYDIESFNPHTGKVINGFEDLDGCDYNAAYCCFAQDRQAGDNNGNCATPYEYNCVDKDPADNANICYVDHERSSRSSHVSGGFSVFGDLKDNKENIEGPVHCHGFAWGDDPLHIDNVFKGNLLFYVSMYDHMTQRGYVRNIPGSPMCACAENMAVVTRSDCTQVATSERVTIKWSVSDGTLGASIDVKDVNFNSCQGLNANNNLEERVKKLHAEGKIGSDKLAALQGQLVGSGNGKCNAAIEEFLGTKNITRIPAGASAAGVSGSAAGDEDFGPPPEPFIVINGDIPLDSTSPVMGNSEGGAGMKMKSPNA